LSKVYTLKPSEGVDFFQTAYRYLVDNGLEISLQDKLKIVDNIDLNSEIDFSGGDPLLLQENRTIIEKASAKFGKRNISITATGIGFSKIPPEILMNMAGNIDFTYDSAEIENVPFRPNLYNYSNLNKVSTLKRFGMNITAQIPLNSENLDPKVIEKIYLNLHLKEIDRVLLMRFLPVGRGSIANLTVPNAGEYRKAVDIYMNLATKYKFPEIKVQTALQTLLSDKYEDASGYTSSHLVINQKGILSSSPWAMDKYGEPLTSFILGDLKTDFLSRLIKPNLKYRTDYTNIIFPRKKKAASIVY